MVGSLRQYLLRQRECVSAGFYFCPCRKKALRVQILIVVRTFYLSFLRTHPREKCISSGQKIESKKESITNISGEDTKELSPETCY